MSLGSLATRMDRLAKEVQSWTRELDYTNGRIRTAEIYRDRCETALADAQARFAVVREKYVAAKMAAAKNHAAEGLQPPRLSAKA